MRRAASPSTSVFVLLRALARVEGRAGGEVEEDAEPRRATVAARTRDDAPRGKPPARSPEYEAELEAWQTQRASHAAQRQAIDDAYQDLLKRIHEVSMDKRPL